MKKPRVGAISSSGSITIGGKANLTGRVDDIAAYDADRSRERSRQRSLNASVERIDAATRKWIVAQWDSAKRQGEPPYAFMKANEGQLLDGLPSDPTIRKILRDAGRIPPARKRK